MLKIQREANQRKSILDWAAYPNFKFRSIIRLINKNTILIPQFYDNGALTGYTFKNRHIDFFISNQICKNIVLNNKFISKIEILGTLALNRVIINMAITKDEVTNANQYHINPKYYDNNE